VVRANASVFQVAGTDLGRVLAHILIGMVVGGLLSLETATSTGPGSPLSDAIGRRALRLNNAFRRVVFAQVRISAINTALTAFYLAFLLPLFGIHLPFTKTLIVLTFVIGLLPIIGNLTSNTVIFIVSLSDSFTVAMGSRYLIIIHKLEYFLNARIIAARSRPRHGRYCWPADACRCARHRGGLIAAPIYYAYLNDETESGLPRRPRIDLRGEARSPPLPDVGLPPPEWLLAPTPNRLRLATSVNSKRTSSLA
jgi:hypothetical protein